MVLEQGGGLGDVMQRDCRVHELNREGAVDCGGWRRWTGDD